MVWKSLYPEGELFQALAWKAGTFRGFLFVKEGNLNALVICFKSAWKKGIGVHKAVVVIGAYELAGSNAEVQ